jgi:hypothetical protein
MLTIIEEPDFSEGNVDNLGDTPGPAANGQDGNRSNRKLLNWFGATASALVVAVISGVVLAVVVPGGELPLTTEPTPSAGVSSPAGDGSPFSLVMQSRGQYCSGYVVTGAKPETLPGPRTKPPASEFDWPTDEEVAAWVKKTGAIPSAGLVTVTLQGRSGAAVILQSLEVEMVSASPGFGAVEAYRTDSECGAGKSPRLFTVTLDSARPSLEPLAGMDDAGNEIPAMAFPFTVSSSDPEIFVVHAETGKCDCQWRLRLRWLSDGRSGSTIIDDEGKPFRTASYDEEKSRHYYESGVSDCAVPGRVTIGAWCG